MVNLSKIKDVNAVLFTVSHEEFCNMSIEAVEGPFKKGTLKNKRMMIGVKYTLNKEYINSLGYKYLRM